MLQNKDIAKIQEIKTLSQASWTQPEFSSEHFQLFQSVMSRGVPFWEIMRVLLVMPFMNIKNVGSLFNCGGR